MINGRKMYEVKECGCQARVYFIPAKVGSVYCEVVETGNRSEDIWKNGREQIIFGGL